MKICVIGFGNMGSALSKGWVTKKILKPSGIIIVDKRVERLRLAQKFKFHTSSNITTAVRNSDTVLIAVKPQDLSVVLSSIKKGISGQLVISIVAGITNHNLLSALGGRTRTIRAMPNTPALVGSGMTAFARGKNATARDAKVVRRLFGAVGETVELRENDLDAVTAVSGSGPAYFSYFLESFLSGARKLGLEKKLAESLVMKTAIGTLELLIQTGMSPEKLTKQVTSKGGTTEAAIRHLESKRFRLLIEQAIKKAWLRSSHLGNK